MPLVVSAATDVDVADAVSDDKSVVKEKGDIGCATDAPVFARSRSLQTTGAIEGISQGNLGMV